MFGAYQARLVQALVCGLCTLQLICLPQGLSSMQAHLLTCHAQSLLENRGMEEEKRGFGLGDYVCQRPPEDVRGGCQRIEMPEMKKNAAACWSPETSRCPEQLAGHRRSEPRNAMASLQKKTSLGVTHAHVEISEGGTDERWQKQSLAHLPLQQTLTCTCMSLA